MSIIIDLIVIAIIALVVYISAKQGFVRTAVGCAGFLLAIVIAFSISGPLADLTYDNFVEPSIIEAAKDKASAAANTTAEQIWDYLPNFITEDSDKYNISKDSINKAIDNSDTAQKALENVSQTSIKPIVSEMIKTVYAVLLFIILLFVVNILAKIINKIFTFSVIGKLNTVLGGVVGVFKGVFTAVLTCKIIMLIISFTSDGIWIFNDQSIENTILFKFLTNIF